VEGYRKIETRLKQTLTLTRSTRQELKNPLGNLLKGSPEETMRQLSSVIAKEKPGCIVTVGDVVSENALRHGIQAHVLIVDSKVMRERVQPAKAPKYKVMHVKNPAGTLTPETWVIVEKALKQKQPARVLVEGEEDLLTLVAVLQSPENSLVVYGQPSEGVVAVLVDKEAKEKAQRVVSAMAVSPKS